MLATAEDRLNNPFSPTLSKAHATLIEAIYRLAYVMALFGREVLFQSGRDGELVDVFAAPRRATVDTVDERPAWAVPC